MRFVAHVHLLDLLDQIVIYAEVLSGDDPAATLEPVLKLSTSLQGEGVTDPREWLADALVALVERV
jgi:hypothetical protein